VLGSFVCFAYTLCNDTLFVTIGRASYAIPFNLIQPHSILSYISKNNFHSIQPSLSPPLQNRVSQIHLVDCVGHPTPATDLALGPTSARELKHPSEKEARRLNVRQTEALQSLLQEIRQLAGGERSKMNMTNKVLPTYLPTLSLSLSLFVNRE
jgi:hypothetical protein